MDPHFRHHLEEEVAVMDAHEPESEDLVHIEQVPDIGPGMVPTRETLAAFLDRIDRGTASLSERRVVHLARSRRGNRIRTRCDGGPVVSRRSSPQPKEFLLRPPEALL